MRLIDADAIPYELWTTEVEVDETRINGTYHCFQNRLMVDRRTIEAIPTIEERPKGKWIEYRTSNGLICAKCSECKTSYGFLKTPFCPNCGADMRGDSDVKK